MKHSLLWFCASLAASASALLAQSSSAALSGVVRDEQDKTVLAAKVVLLDQAKGLTKQANTDANGAFVFSQIAPSTYELVVEHAGFAKASYPDLVVNADDHRSMRITLKVAQHGETVTVTGEAPLVREAPSVATAVDRRFIENQPLNGRSFQTLINLSPGVVITAASLPENGQFSVNGQRTGSNYFTVDGVSANFGLPFATSPYEGSGGGTPSYSAGGGSSALASVDAVQEFTVQTSTYAPEYGRQPGAQVAIVTRSGTNFLHGSAFNYLRNDKLDANRWFGNYNGLKRPALRQNDFGFTAGGPVWIPKLYDGRNRTFFFASYEGLRLVQPVISPTVRVPSLAARQRATGLLRNILDAYPLPVAAPLAEAPDETPYVAGFSNPSSLNATSVRIDHAVNSRITLFGRYNYAPSESRERGRYATPSFIAVLPAKTETVTTGATMLISSSMNNDLRVNWSRSQASQNYVQDTFGGAKILLLESLIPSFADPATSLYYLSIGGNDENTITPGAFSHNTQSQVNIVDTLSWNIGGHSLKFGGDYRRLAPSLGGRFFSNTLTVPSITQLATGIVPTGTTSQIDRFLEPRYHNTSVYAQDAWRVAPRLTLTFGVRWEVNPAPSGDDTSLPLVVKGLANPSTAALAPKGTPFYDTTYNNFAPRAGIAYQPFRGRLTMIRAGFGVFYDLGYAFAGTALSPTNYPFSRSRTVANRNISDPIFLTDVGPLNENPPYPRLFSFYDGFKLPYTLQYSFAIEQPLGSSNSFSVSYVGAAGRRLARVESLRTQTLQNPSFTRIDAVSNLATSNYNSLQTQFKRRMTRRFQALLSYTWSKSIDTASDESINNLYAPGPRLSPSLDRGPSSFDLRHAFTGSASYDLPARPILKGFSIDSVIRLRSALPVTPTTGRDPLGLGLTNVARPDLVPGAPLYLYGDGYAGGKRFNAAAFDGATPLAQARQGTLGRGTLRGFSLAQLDLAVRRRFVLREGLALDFRAEAFNLLNTPNFANPTGVMTSPNFGRSVAILSTGLAGASGQNPLFVMGGPRSIQLALKLQF
jgi:Carboxypeptidase regulatory-like domain/TonB-dependent Receptor Plug Domain/TonB dependent receptor